MLLRPGFDCLEDGLQWDSRGCERQAALKKKAEPLLTLPAKHFPVKLENDTYANLNNAACKLNVLRIRESRTFDAGILREEVRQVSSVGVSAVDSVTWVRVIQHVECLAAKLNGQALHHLDVLEEPHVQLVELRSAQGIARGATERRVEDLRRAGSVEDEPHIAGRDAPGIASCVQFIQREEAVHVGDMVYVPSAESVQLADADKPWVGVRVTDERTVARTDIGLGGY